MNPRILMALPQMPQDPASGAARSARTTAEIAAEAGFEVRALATTATERGAKTPPLEYLQSLGLEVNVTPPSNRNRREFRFTQRGIPYTLLDTGTFGVMKWEPPHGRQFDILFDRELETFEPDILFTYGGLAGDLRRHRRARLKGCRIVFRVANLGYLQRGFFDHIDAVLTPSQFLAARYRDAIGIESTPLPPPLDLEDVIAAERDPIFVTMINPSVEKGVFFFARLAEELGKRHPEIAILAIESRGVAGMVVEAGLRGGFDLRRHESIMIAGAVPMPRDIYTNSRVLTGALGGGGILRPRGRRSFGERRPSAGERSRSAGRQLQRRRVHLAASGRPDAQDAPACPRRSRGALDPRNRETSLR